MTRTPIAKQEYYVVYCSVCKKNMSIATSTKRCLACQNPVLSTRRLIHQRLEMVGLKIRCRKMI